MPVFNQDPKIEKSVMLTTAVVGQTIVVKAVDENGKPTEWEAIDFPEGGGAKSYNDLADRPLYADSVTIEWDGDTEGTPFVDIGGVGLVLYKVSDKVAAADELVGGVLTFNADGYKAVLTEADITDSGSNGYPVLLVKNGVVIIVYEQIDQEGIVVTTGTYFTVEGGLYSTSLTYGTLKKLDSKYLPDDIGVNITEVSSPEEIPADAEDGSWWVAPKQESEESGGGLHVVEITTPITDVAAPLSETESAILTKAAETRLPIVAKLSMDGMSVSAIFTFISSNLMVGYSCNLDGYTINVIYTEGVWTVVGTIR